MVNKMVRAAIVASIFAGLLTACTSADTGSRISGQVRWADQPVEGVTVELRTGDGVAMTALTDRQGQYVLRKPAVGDYVLWAIWPDGVAGGSGGSIQVAARDSITGIDIPICRELVLIAPSSGEEVGEQPTLEWAAFDGAVEYRVLVINAGTTAVITDERTPHTSLTVAETLEPGQTYSWVVQASDANDNVLAELTNLFTIKE